MAFYYKDITLTIPKTVYEPGDDSLLMAQVLESLDVRNKTVLDMGSGSGLLAIIAAKKHAQVTAVDIHQDARATVQQNARDNNVQIRVISSNLFEQVHGMFDIILFNPPYLPTTAAAYDHDPQWSGGRTGRSCITQFAQTVGAHLAPQGSVYLLASSRTGIRDVQTIFEKEGFSATVIKTQKIPWEELVVLRFETTVSFLALRKKRSVCP